MQGCRRAAPAALAPAASQLTSACVSCPPPALLLSVQPYESVPDFIRDYYGYHYSFRGWILLILVG